jgi:hypothetical protein
VSTFAGQGDKTAEQERDDDPDNSDHDSLGERDAEAE